MTDTVSLFDVSFDLAAASESLLMHRSTEAFICAKLKYPAWKVLLFCQVRCQCWQKESSMLKFFVFRSRSETTHIVSFLFSDSCFSAAQTAKISLLILTDCLTRQPYCFACALQPPALQPPSFCLHGSLMHRQANQLQRWNRKALL